MIYQLKITLRGIRPPIWRRVLVPGDYSLYRLHRLIQVVMGWEDSHLHAFTIGGEYYGIPSPEDWEPVIDERRHTLQRVAGEQHKFLYEYDFGDGWEHQIVVEKILPPEPGRQYPVCVTGKRACPPEEVGGIRGYADFLKAIGDPGHEEHDQVLRWVGGEFDPEAFSCEAVNATLDAVSRKRRSRK